MRTLLIFTALLLFGVISFFYLPLEEMPGLSLPYIRVITEFPGYPPREVEQLITIPLENALTAVKGVKKLSSLSRTGMSGVTLEFGWSVSLDRAVLEVRETIDSLYPYLPEGVKKPAAFTESFSDKPVLTLVCLPAEGINPEDLYIPVKYDLKTRLQRNPAVSRVKIRGLKKPEILIEADMEKLYGTDRTITSLSVYLGQFLIDHPAGKIQEGNRERLLQVSTGINTLEEITALPIGPGSRLNIGDIAKVSYGTEEASSLFFYQGEEALGIEIYKSGSAGTMQAASQIRRSIPSLNRAFREQFTLILLEDRSLEIKRTLSALLISLFLGLLAAVGVLSRLYRGVVVPLITALSILLTMGLVFLPLFLGHISLNTISLLGMVIAVGLLADSTILMLEEIKVGRAPGKILPVILSSSLTTILVFLPPLFVPGVIAALFRDLILTIVILISLSLPVARYFTPACYSLLVPSLRDESPMPWLNCLERRYKRLILTGMKQSRKTKFYLVGAYFTVIILSLLLMSAIPRELIPETPSEHIKLSVPLPEEWDYSRTAKETVRLSHKLEDVFSGIHITVDAGYEADSLRNRLEPGRSIHCPDFHLYADKPFQNGTLNMLTTMMEELGYRTAQAVKQRNSLESLLLPTLPTPVREDRQILWMVPDRQSLSAFNLSASDLQRELGSVLRGLPAGEVPFDREKITVRLRASREYRDSPKALGGLKLLAEEGWIALDELVGIEERTEPAELIRINRDSPGKDDAPYEGKSFIRLYLFALLLLFLILGIQTGSLGDALLLFLALPVSLSGSFILIKLCGFSLNLYSFMGILIMQGTVINTAILLLDGIEKGSRGEILYRSGLRIRPVLATLFTTVSALLPVLCRSLLKRDAAGGMAAAVIGGMLIGTALILWFLPLFCYHFREGEGTTK